MFWWISKDEFASMFERSEYGTKQQAIIAALEYLMKKEKNNEAE